MFESFYRFDENPFRLNPDEKFRYIHPNYLKAWSYLKYGLDHAEGFVMITGEPGTGKTTLVRSMLSELDPAKYLQVTLVSNQLQAEELLRLLALEFGFNADTYNKATLLTRLQSHASEQYTAGRRTIIIVDEAQNLDPQALEELRLLSNLQAGNQALFQIFLIGQEELRNLVLGPGMEQLKQRLVATFRIEAMNATQTEGYIEHRLGVVGWLDDPSLNPSIYPLIYRFTQGIPRKINHILSRLLLYGALEEKHRLDQDDVWVVLEELNEEARLLPDSSMDFEALRRENRAHVLKDEVAHQKVAQSDIAIQEPLITEPSNGENKSITNHEAPSNRIPQKQPSNGTYYPPNRSESLNPFPDATSHSSQAGTLTETDLPDTQPKTSSLAENHADRLSLDTDEKAEPEPLSITTTIEQAVIESVPEPQPEPDSPDRKDLLFGGLERFFHWAAYAVGIAAFAFVILLPQTNELADLWQDLKHQGLQILSLTPQHQADSQPPQVLEPTAIAQAETISEAQIKTEQPDLLNATPNQAKREIFPQREPEEQVHELPVNQFVTYGNTRDKPIDETSIERSDIEGESSEQSKTMDHATGIKDIKPHEPGTQQSPTQLLPSEPVTAQISDQHLQQSYDAEVTTQETDLLNAANVKSNLEADKEAAIRQKELAIRQAAEAAFQSQLALELNEKKAQTDTHQSAPQDLKSTDTGLSVTATPADQPQKPTPMPPRTHQVYFKFNSTEISDEYIPLLNSVLDILSQQNKTLVEITGFTDPIGDQVYNKLLSFRRAKSVANYLIDRGISQGRIHVTGGGALPAQPGIETEGPEQLVDKRRVEIKTITILDGSEP